MRLDPVAIQKGHEACDIGGQDVMQALLPLLEQYQAAGLIEPRYRFYDLTCAGKYWHVQINPENYAISVGPIPSNRANGTDYT